MITVDIPGYPTVNIKNIVMDYNGTVAEDGMLFSSLKAQFKQLIEKEVNLFILTADTFGTVKNECKDLPVQVIILNKDGEYKNKKSFILDKGPNETVSIGNGRNDEEMFESSLLSIAVIGKEGCFSKSLLSADIVVTNINDALNLLLKPNRLKATLRI